MIIFSGISFVTNFQDAFQSCTSITSIPPGLFSSESILRNANRKILLEDRKKKLERLKNVENRY